MARHSSVAPVSAKTTALRGHWPEKVKKRRHLSPHATRAITFAWLGEMDLCRRKWGVSGELAPTFWAPFATLGVLVDSGYCGSQLLPCDRTISDGHPSLVQHPHFHDCSDWTNGCVFQPLWKKQLLETKRKRAIQLLATVGDCQIVDCCHWFVLHHLVGSPIQLDDHEHDCRIVDLVS